MRIAVATFGRSDLSILRPLARLMHDLDDFDVGFWAGGAHFEATSGRTISDVEATGVPIWARIDVGERDRSPRSTVASMAAQMEGFADAATGANAGPDIVLILGDRFEAVAAGLAMVPLGVPVGHISGGSITEGAIDDVFRHCLTKIAVAHFCDLPEFARRIHRMGEPTDRIFTTGALGLDAWTQAPRRGFAELVEHFGLTGLRPGFALATLHPETHRPDVSGPMAEAMMRALGDVDTDVVVTYPNADPTADQIVAIVERFAREHDRVHVVRSFGADWFPTALEHAGLMVGNSSGGIIEAASFALPVVDIGDRQKGRSHGGNVIHCGRDRSEIRRALEAAAAPRFRERAAAPNIYGDGRGAERVIVALRALDRASLAAPPQFADYDPTFVGELLALP